MVLLKLVHWHRCEARGYWFVAVHGLGSALELALRPAAEFSNNFLTVARGQPLIPAKGAAGNSAWTQAACGTVWTCKSEHALQAGIHLAYTLGKFIQRLIAPWIPAFAGMTSRVFKLDGVVARRLRVRNEPQHIGSSFANFGSYVGVHASPQPTWLRC